ncbi:MAG: HD domain-containing protein [Bacteroidia bacterium]|nr:MAG: HD domain-containing protein [Bacteroidia bacterium]
MKVATNKRKIINDPVHGFISITGDFIYDLIQNPFFQRLRYIRQLGLTDNVYPGASHTRFIHSLGALHLISQAIGTLRMKGVDISDAEAEAVQAAILFHDIGHGPFSHALEHLLIDGVSHEMISLFVMNFVNREYRGKLDLAIEMFKGKYRRQFFHDLISSQIDMDRLDYLVRDSFFTGVIEGSVGADRIIKMLNVCNDRLVVDEKGIYSIEKFLIARRLMYWQVYMHKTVLSAEKLLVKIIDRAKELTGNDNMPESATSVSFFLENNLLSSDFLTINDKSASIASNFLSLDDNEMITSIRKWSGSNDNVLSDLSRRLLFRNFLAIELSNKPFEEKIISDLKKRAERTMGIGEKESGYYIYTDSVSNMAYAPSAPRVRIMDKTGVTREITEVSDMLDHRALSKEVKKFFLCYPKELRD